MKLKIVVVDFEIPMRAKKWAIRAGIPVFVLSVAAVAWAAPLHTWTTGDTLNATDLNGNFANLQAQISALQKPPSGFRAIVTTTAPNVPSDAYTPIVFNDVLFDLGSEYNATTGKFTAKYTGTYMATCAVYYTAGGETEYAAILQINGNNYDGTDMTGNTGISARPEAVAIMNLTAGDTVQCATYQDTASSAALNIGGPYNAFSVTRVY